MSQKPPVLPSTSRRAILAAGAATGAAVVADAAVGPLLAGEPLPRAAKDLADKTSTLTFTELEHGLDEHHKAAPGHDVQILLRWGDPVLKGAPVWTPTTQTPAAQKLQFGYDNDYIAFMPLPYGSKSSTSGLLCVNHESSRSHLMFPGYLTARPDDITKEQVDIEMAANGHTVVKIDLKGGEWKVDTASPFNRRTMATTEVDIAGPAAGHKRMRTTDDPTGTRVFGALSGCAGGYTPWGTVLLAEENVQHYFGGDPRKTSEAYALQAIGVGAERFYGWHNYYPRFNVEKEINEVNRFGWIVEIDPYEPKAKPIKRTALGRFKHESATIAVNRDGRVVAYLGDDEVFQHIYKFVSAKTYDPKDRGRNAGLLDEGTLYAARFNADNTITWLPLIWGQGPLREDNGFDSQAEVLIDVRRAARQLGATQMDRPEDIEVHPRTGSVFVTLTKNSKRTPQMVDAANPRARNRGGHIMEILPLGEAGEIDHAATTSRWRILLKAGDPNARRSGTDYNAGITENGWLACPDNLAIDNQGRLWITTDGGNDFGIADGIWATDVEGPGRGLTRHFFRCPDGGEVTGPAFTPDGTTLFCSVQHPGDIDDAHFASEPKSWPDFKEGVPPRPSVVAIRRTDGKVIG